MPGRVVSFARRAGTVALVAGLVMAAAPSAFAAGYSAGETNGHPQGPGKGHGPSRGCGCRLPVSFDFAEFSSGNVNQSSGLSAGPAAFGGTASLAHFAISTNPAELNPFYVAFVAGGPVSGGGSTSIHYGNGYYDATLGGVVDHHGTLHGVSPAHLPVNFPQTSSADNAFSAKLAGLFTSPGDLATTSSSTLTLSATTTESNNIYVWDLSPGELTGITSLKVTGVPTGGDVIVNVTDAGPLVLSVTSVSLDGQSAGAHWAGPALAASTIFNFPDATTLGLTGAWAGTIFAPGAVTSYSHGWLWGSIDAASLTATDEATLGPLLRPFCIPRSGPGTDPGGGGPGTQLPEGQPVEMVGASAVIFGGFVLVRRRRRRRVVSGAG